MDSDGHLRAHTSTAIRDLFTSGEAVAPINSLDLLVKVIAIKSPCSPSTSSKPIPPFRLTDLRQFEGILESLAHDWEHGEIQLSREGPQARLYILDIRTRFQSDGGPLDNFELIGPRKRKRVKDEDADSAAGGEDDQSSLEDNSAAMTPLGGLNKDLREVYAILKRGTAKGKLLAEQFRSQTANFEPICSHVTKEECIKHRESGLNPSSFPCSRIHFRPLIRPHTDPALGHCSYLNTCYSEPTYAHSPSIPPFPGTVPPFVNANVNQRGATSLPSGLGAGGRGKEKAPCRYLHFEVDLDADEAVVSTASTAGGTSGPGRGNGSGKDEKSERDVVKREPLKLGIGLGPQGKDMKVLPPQWINCDLRRFDYSVLGKFHAIMADPPWDIHMSLPYGTMTDDEMRAMPIPMLQDEGFLFLWVTGRAMEVGRECLRVWGYTRVDEVIWVKTNQLQRVIRTGRTGHWLNHTKEHMLVGMKTIIDPATGQLKFPSWANRGMDTDVIVSEVRETSRKPDEVYGLIERICPGGRKVEIFGRKHNTRPGWLTLGNQLGADQIYEEDLAARIQARYPERNAVGPSNVRS